MYFKGAFGEKNIGLQKLSLEEKNFLFLSFFALLMFFPQFFLIIVIYNKI